MANKYNYRKCEPNKKNTSQKLLLVLMENFPMGLLAFAHIIRSVHKRNAIFDNAESEYFQQQRIDKSA